MQKRSFLFCLLHSCLFGFCQKPMPGFGKIEKADLEMKACPFEPEANAMKIFDIQEVSMDMFTYGTRVKTEHHIRIKIFNEKGYKYAAVKIPYFSKKGVAKIKLLNGIVYNLDPSGKIIKETLGLTDFFDEKAIENVGIINFTFPKLKPGSIIEYKFTTIENYIFSVPSWIIQGDIPVAYTELAFVTPAKSGIYQKVFGADSIENTMYYFKNDQFKRTTFFRSNIPSFQPEPFMSSHTDHKLRVIFLINPYSNIYNENRELVEQLWKIASSRLFNSAYYEKQISNVIKGTESIIDSAKKIRSVTGRIGYVYEAVKKRWTGYHEQTLELHDLTEAWNNKIGTSAEINLILMNILDKADVKCYPVLISTRSNGKVNREFPSLGQMNGLDIIAFDSTQYFLLDASLKQQSFRNPPANILNREAMIMSRDSVQWITVVDNRPLMKQSVNLIAEMKLDGTIEGTANIQYFDYAKSDRVDSAQKDEEENKFFDKKPLGLKILSTSRDLTEDPADPLYETVEFTYEPQNTNESFYFINPQLFTEFNKNPFPAEKRKTEIDLGCNQLFILSMQLDLGNYFVVDNLPKNITIMAPDSSFFYKISYSIAGQKIFITQLFEIKKALFPSSDYSGIKDFFKRMGTSMAEEIILKKK